jgi:2-oxoglutarate ferredoxin oxidoreductase subunit gamma
MEKSLIIAGFGGQGVMVCGQLIGYTVSDTTDDYVTFFPTYGAEQRGGTANCYVVISDEEIGSPMSDEADYAMILNNPSLTKFQDRVKPDGTIFMDSSVVTIDTDRKDVKVIKVPAGEIAIELGNTKVANLVMVGAFVGFTGLLPPEKVLATAFKKLGAKRPHLNPLNEAAFNRGLEIGKAAR